MDQSRAGIVVLTGQDYLSVMLHWNPKPIRHTVYHHLLHRLTQGEREQHRTQQKWRGEIKWQKSATVLQGNFGVTEASNLQSKLQTPPIIFPQPCRIPGTHSLQTSMWSEILSYISMRKPICKHLRYVMNEEPCTNTNCLKQPVTCKIWIFINDMRNEHYGY